jgi:hypothetical protein
VNLQQLRDAVRRQLDVDEEELPNETVDDFLREAFSRTINFTNNWPFFESDWDVVKPEGALFAPIPANINPTQLISLKDSETGYRLLQVDHGLAEDRFIDAYKQGTVYMYWSVWGGQIYFWPAPVDQSERTFHLRGHRMPTDWIAAGATGVPDCDERLHQLLIHYAIALAYAQQEDEVLEDVYMKRWQSNLNMIAGAILKPRYHRPGVLSGGIDGGFIPTSVRWNLPT